MPNYIDIASSPYSAVAGQDCTSAIQQALIDLVNSGGGTIYIPYATQPYKISGTLKTSVNSVNPNCQIYIPLYDQTNKDKFIHIRILGSSPNSFATESFGGIRRNIQGVILESTIQGTGNLPCVFGSSWKNYAGIGDRNYVHVHFENIIVRTSTVSGTTNIAGTMTGLNFSHINSFSYDKLKIDISSTLIDAVEPINETFGLIFPSINNKAELFGGELFLEGYKYGVVLQEHFVGKYIIAGGCKYGVVIDHGYHGINIQTLLVEGCSVSILMRGEANLYITSYHSEHYNTGWYKFVYDVYFENPPSAVVPSFNDNLAFRRTRSVYIEHANQVTPSYGVEGKFVTNDNSYVFLQRLNNIYFDKTFQKLSDEPTITFDLLKGHLGTVTLNGNRSLKIINAFIGDRCELYVTQGGSVSNPYNLAPPSFSYSSSGNFNIATAALAVTKISGLYSGKNWIWETQPVSPVQNSFNFPTMNLQGYWKLDQIEANNTFLDSSPNAFNLSFPNGINVVTGKILNCAQFSSIGFQFLRRSANNLFSADTGLTIGGWFNLSDLNATQGLISKDAPGNREYALYISGNVVHFLMSSDSTGNNIRDIGTPLTTPNFWNFIVAVWDGSEMKLFVNNQLGATAIFPSIYRNGTAEFRIGEISNYYLSGKADECFIYNRGLSYEEINYLFNEGAGRTI